MRQNNNALLYFSVILVLTVITSSLNNALSHIPQNENITKIMVIGRNTDSADDFVIINYNREIESFSLSRKKTVCNYTVSFTQKSRDAFFEFIGTLTDVNGKDMTAFTNAVKAVKTMLSLPLIAECALQCSNTDMTSEEMRYYITKLYYDAFLGAG